MYSEQEARDLVINACHELVARKLIARTWGNISARISDDEFVITPSGIDYGILEPDDLVVVNVNGLTHEGDRKPSSEKGVHATAYILRKDVNFIIHTHQYFASVIAAGCRNTWVAPCADYALPGTGKLMTNVERIMLEYPDDKAFLLARHGALILGSTPEEAFGLADKLEQDSRKQFASRVPSMDITRYENAAVDQIISDDAPFVTVARDEYILECCRAGVTLRAYVDDFAQIAGPDIACVENKAGRIRMALSGDPVSARVLRKTGLAGRNAVLVKGVGAVCTGKSQDDADAVAQIVSKNAACACYARKVKPLGWLDARLQRVIYIKSYSKRRNGTASNGTASNGTASNSIKLKRK